MLPRGIQTSINSDIPGLLGYEGVTMDYVMVALAWQLNLKEFKKLSLNGITYSSVSEEKKKHLKEVVFPQQWKKFLELINEKY